MTIRGLGCNRRGRRSEDGGFRSRSGSRVMNDELGAGKVVGVHALKELLDLYFCSVAKANLMVHAARTDERLI